MTEPEQRSLFQYYGDQEPAVESWSRVVARRMQATVMGFPVHQLVSKGESGYYPDWQGQNFTFLALQVFDSVFARMAPGIGQGATREEVIHDLAPYVRAREPKITENQVEAIVDFVLNALLNDGKGSFEAECIWLDEQERPKPYRFRYGLLRSYHDPETDRFILRATPEAIHLYLRMLDQPVEDEQIANLFILREQIRRGRISHSRREAERSMLLSLEYERYIEDMLRAVRRDVRSVDWVKEVSPRIQEAHEHVGRLVQEQGKLLRELKKELHLHEDRARLKSIHELIEVLELCQRRHMELERRILAAGPAFLEEQAYQRFRSLARLPMPDLNEQVFLPALTIEEPFFKPILPGLYHTMLGPRIHRIMDLEVMIDRFLRDEMAPEWVTDPDDLEDRVPIDEVYDPLRDEVEERIAEILAVLDVQPIRLSEILERGREQGMGVAELSLVGVTFLHSYHERSDLLGLKVKRDGNLLDDPDFCGDDLLISRSREDLAETESLESAHAGRK